MANNNDKKVFNVPALRFPEFTDEWEETELQNTVPNICAGKDKHSNDGTIVLYGSTGIIGMTTNPSYTEELILVARVGANAGQLQVTNTPCGVTDNTLVINAKSWNLYIYYYLQHYNLNRLVFGSGQPLITGGMLKKIKVMYGIKSERDKITHMLCILDERIKLQNKIIEKLQSLIKGIVDELMTVLLKGKLYPFSSFYIKAGEGGTPTTSVNEYYLGGTIPFIKIEDLSCKYLTSNKDFITELGMQKSSAWLIPSHSVIYSNGATIGAISINEYPICTKQGILGIVPNTNINVEYLYLLMSSSYFSKEVNRIVTEGTMKTAYLKDINHIKCPLPSMAQQQNITNLTSSIEKKLFVEQELLKLLNIQKQHLLRTMFI